MTNEQLTEIEHNLGLGTQFNSSNITQQVEVRLKGNVESAMIGDYNRSPNGTLIRLRRGVITNWIDIDSIAAIGVINR